MSTVECKTCKGGRIPGSYGLCPGCRGKRQLTIMPMTDYQIAELAGVAGRAFNPDFEDEGGAETLFFNFIDCENVVWLIAERDRLRAELDALHTAARRADSELSMALAWGLSIEAQRYVQEARAALARVLGDPQ